MTEQTQAVLKTVREFDLTGIPDLVKACEDVLLIRRCRCLDRTCCICKLRTEVDKVKRSISPGMLR